MGRRVTIALSLALAATAAPAAAFELEPLPGTYDQPVHVAGPPGDASRVLVVEQTGRIRLVKDGVSVAAPFLDVSARADVGGEEGLLSMAFAPDYATTGRFYVFYTADTGTNGNDLVVEQHRVAPGGDAALAGSAAEVIRIPHRVGNNHNGGQLHFGPDGNLWISTGDGGGTSGDSDGDAQDPNRLLGKILRIAPLAGGNYAIPAGNPFAGGGGRPEVWATGLRNPWRFSFDRATGDLYVGDVGEGTMEEVDRMVGPGRAPGANFGWPYYEGTRVLGSGPQPATHHAPLFTHTRAEGWRAIAGGYVIRDPSFTEAGRYVYGDFFVDRLWLYDPATGTRAPTGAAVDMLSGFGEDGVGRLYATSLGGTVHRLVGDGGPPPPPGDMTPPGAQPPSGGGGDGGLAPGGGVLPTVRLSLAGTPTRQRALRRRAMLVRARCDTACRLTAGGRLTAGRRRFALPPARASLRAGERRLLRVRIGPRALRAARRALRRGSRVRVALAVRATAESGAAARRTLRVAIGR